MGRGRLLSHLGCNFIFIAFYMPGSVSVNWMGKNNVSEESYTIGQGYDHVCNILTPYDIPTGILATSAR